VAIDRAETGNPAQARVLVVCATARGSTTKVAEAVADELRAAGAYVDVAPAPGGADPAGYDAVVVGGPMIMGWHKDALRYLKTHQAELASRPTAYFLTAMSLTDTADVQVEGVPVFKDPGLAKPPRTAGKLGLKERYATPAHYLRKPFKKAPRLRPATVAFFGGSLDLTQLNIFQMLFVVAVVRATPGDGRNWEAIRGWARELLPQLMARDAG
jgi:menaquinone-dependent protoporphyrinogen oxidase